MRIFEHSKRSSFLPKTIAAAMFGAVVLTTPVSAADGGALATLFGQKSQKFLPVNQAFQVATHIEGNDVVATFKVTPKHYVYRDKLSLNLPEGVSAGEWSFDKTPTTIDDPEFGRVAVFEEDVVARATLTGVANNASASLRWQGCAKAGLCYPPEMTKFTIVSLANGNTQKPSAKSKPKPENTQKIPAASLAGDKNNTQKTDEIAKSISITDKEKLDKNQSFTTTDDKLDKTADDLAPLPKLNTADDTKNAADFSQNIRQSRHQLDHHLDKSSDLFGVHDNPILAVGLLFLAGLLLAFTPCVYPMIPIVANIVAHQNSVNSKKGLALSAAYGVGVAMAYGMLGALIAWFGRALNIVGYLQNPVILVGFAVLFVALGLFMFDAFKVNLPAFLRNKLQHTAQSADDKLGSLGGSFLSGALSALVVSPCVSAPMAGALAAVSTSGSAVFGFLALFALGLGLSVPLMVFGMAQGKIMPKSGVWMTKVKEFCGLLLFAVAIMLIERVLSSSLLLVIWAVWFGFMALWLWRLVRLPFRALSVLGFVWAACLMVGAGMGAKDAWRPLGMISQQAKTAVYQDRHITTLSELDEILSSHDKVLIDMTADWCVECRIMERNLFTHRPSGMNDVQLVRFDITNTTDDSRAALARYELMGPPALLMYKNGKLVNVLLGEVGRAEFESALADF